MKDAVAEGVQMPYSEVCSVGANAKMSMQNAGPARTGNFVNFLGGRSMLHRTSQERYEKLKRVFARLMERFNRDDLDDFIQTANSLREWIMQDDTLSSEQRAHLERFVVPKSLDWQNCHQIANAQKHVKANARSKKMRNAQPAPAVTVAEVKYSTGFVVPSSSRI